MLPTFRRRGRLRKALRWTNRVIAGTAIAGTIALFSGPSVTGWLLERERARLRAEGAPLTLAEVVPRVPPGRPNAADIYQKAFPLRRVDEPDLLQDRRPEDARWRSGVRALLAKNTPYLALIEQASRIPDCAFSVDWAGGPEKAAMPHLAGFREATRLFGARAVLLACDGRGDEALAQCETVLRIADHARADPPFVASLVAWAVRAIDVDVAETVLSLADQSPEACRAVQTALARVDQRAELLRALRTESVCDTQYVHERARRMVKNNATLGPYLIRTQLNLGERGFLRKVDAQIAVAALPWPDSYRQAKRIVDPFEHGAWYSSWDIGYTMSAMVFPNAAHALQVEERIQARLDALQIALALKQYKGRCGSYPDSLAALRAAGYDIPRDRFTGKEFVYRREGAGFLIYSLGPDMDDDNGRDFLKDKRRTKKPIEHGKELWDTDVPFRCTR